MTTAVMKKEKTGFSVYTDSQLTCGNLKTQIKAKYFIVNDMTIAFAGDLSVFQKMKYLDYPAVNDEDFEKYLVKDFIPMIKEFTEDEDSDIEFLLHYDGEIYQIDEDSFVKINDFAAIGSGAEIALGALEAGAKADQAVRIASKYDIYTNDKIGGFSTSY